MEKVRKIIYLIIIGLVFIAPIHSQASIEVTLTWSADTYVPLDYPGKPLPSRNSNIEVAANIDSLNINPQTAIYNWFLDDAMKKEQSGPGKQIFQFNIGESLTKTRLVKLEVWDQSGNFINSANLLIKPSAPEIILKSKNHLSTSFDLIPQYQIAAGQETYFIAQPYFFNIKNINQLDYQWSFGNQTASQINSLNPHILSLKIDQIETSFKEILNLWAKNKTNPLQQAQAKAEVIIIP